MEKEPVLIFFFSQVIAGITAIVVVAVTAFLFSKVK
jgi:hypothetical protein